MPTMQRLHASNSSHGQLNLIVPKVHKHFKKRNKSLRPARTLRPPEPSRFVTRDQHDNSILIYEEGRQGFRRIAGPQLPAPFGGQNAVSKPQASQQSLDA